MGVSFSAKGDAMPLDKLGKTRGKLIHSVGDTGKVKFVPSAN